MVAFADDVALVVVAKDIQDLEYYGDKSIEVVAGWLSRHGLSLAAEKIEAVILMNVTIANITIKSIIIVISQI